MSDFSIHHLTIGFVVCIEQYHCEEKQRTSHMIPSIKKIVTIVLIILLQMCLSSTAFEEAESNDQLLNDHLIDNELSENILLQNQQSPEPPAPLDGGEIQFQYG